METISFEYKSFKCLSNKPLDKKTFLHYFIIKTEHLIEWFDLRNQLKNQLLKRFSFQTVFSKQVCSGVSWPKIFGDQN